MYQDTSVSTFENNVYQNLGPKTFWFFVSERSVTSIIFFVLALLLAIARVKFVSPDIAGLLRFASWGSLIIAIIAFLVAFISAKLAYKSLAFMLSEDALKIRHGVMTQEEKAIPYRQIQNIEIERSISQRFAGLSRVIIATATNDDPNTKSEHEGHNILPAMDADVALRFQAELLKRANIQKVIQVKQYK